MNPAVLCGRPSAGWTLGYDLSLAALPVLPVLSHSWCCVCARSFFLGGWAGTPNREGCLVQFLDAWLATLSFAGNSRVQPAPLYLV